MEYEILEYILMFRHCKQTCEKYSTAAFDFNLTKNNYNKLLAFLVFSYLLAEKYMLRYTFNKNEYHISTVRELILYT